MNTSFQFKNKRIVIIGLGLIGGSIARAVVAAELAATVTAVDRDEAVLKSAVQQGVLNGYSLSVREGCQGADLIIIAVPGLSVAGVLAEIKDVITDSVVITDVASVKKSTIAAAVRVFGKVPANFVAGHPIAGSEQSGFAAAKTALFTGKKVILTPVENTSESAVAFVRDFWQSLGSEVLQMSVEYHDEILAATSHLPHLLAFALVDTLSQQGESEEIFRFAAGGFRDFTRIASSDPVMWRDVFLANGAATVNILDKYIEDLYRLRSCLNQGDGPELLETFKRAKTSRDKFMENSKAASEHGTVANNQAIEVTEEAHDLTFNVEPAGTLTGDIRVPGDKSISHRSIMLGSIAEGLTTVEGFLEGEDSLATLSAFRAMGVTITDPVAGKLSIEGVGLHGLQQPEKQLYLGNSGTSMRLLCGLLAGQKFSSTLTGDESLSKRPMRRVTDPLATMGAQIKLQGSGVAPIEISPARLSAINVDMKVASAQVKSCILLAGMYAEGETVVTEPAPCRDHTERMLRGFGYEVQTKGPVVSIKGGGKLTASHIDVPADISSAAFFLVGASISPGSDLLLRHVGINPTRTGVINILRLMGADIVFEREYEAGGEPVADIRVRYAPLKGIRIPEAEVPLAIDEFPVLFIAAACAQGETVLSGAEELRVKESDRIQSMADGLEILGVKHTVKPDGIIIAGSTSEQVFGSGEINSRGDHRIAMAFTMASLRAAGQITILDCNNVATSFPDFASLAAQCGISLTVSSRAS